MIASEYRKLIVIAWLMLVAAMAAIRGGDAWHGVSWDTDDFMRLIQVRDWLAGQGWSDLTQYRLNPPAGTPMHWSRLPDLALAAVTLALSPFLSINDALTVAAMVVPPLYFLLFLIVYAVPARLMLGMARSPVGLLVALFGSIAIAQFLPGRVDHHGLQVIMVMAAVALLLMGLACGRWRMAIVLAGIPIAVSAWIGVEMLPVIAVWFAALGLVWCRSGGAAARLGAGAAGLAALIGLALIFVAVPPERRLVPACDAFSIMPVGSLALIAGGFAGMALLDRWLRGVRTRLAAAALCGGGVAVLFALAFPDCLGGGLGDLDPEVRRHWLEHVSEAVSLGEQFQSRPTSAMGMLWTPLLGLAYSLWRCAGSLTRGRTLWGVLALLIAAATALMFWQVRAVSVAQSLALLPLAGLLAGSWRRLSRRTWPRWRQFLVLLPLVFVCSVVFWGAVDFAYRQVASAVFHAPPAPKIVTEKCSDRRELPVLADAPPTLILSYIDIGPMLLFSTPHAVLGAPYHRNIGGLKATISLFRSSDDAWIRDRLHALGIGWVAACSGPEDMVAYVTTDKNGLAERLAAGNVPAYLSQVADPAHPGLRLYRVLP